MISDEPSRPECSECRRWPEWRVVLLGAICCTTSLVAQLVNSPDSIALRGRIVLYDWVLHDHTTWEDVVVSVEDGAGDKPTYVRAIYRPVWGFDASQSPANSARLNPWAFVARGRRWTFHVHPPKGFEEERACSEVAPDPKFDDEMGTGSISRYRTTPGASGDGIPAVKSIRCMILSFVEPVGKGSRE